jgi:hypothetical protein
MVELNSANLEEPGRVGERIVRGDEMMGIFVEQHDLAVEVELAVSEWRGVKASEPPARGL